MIETDDETIAVDRRTRPWRGFAQLDDEGRLQVPPEVALRCGLTPGSRVWLETTEGGAAVLHPPATTLARVYVEPTNACNLACRTCVRHVRDEALGIMEPLVFERVLEGVRATEPRFMRLTSKFYVRGGIFTNVVAEHRKAGWQPAPRVELTQFMPNSNTRG